MSTALDSTEYHTVPTEPHQCDRGNSRIGFGNYLGRLISLCLYCVCAYFVLKFLLWTYSSHFSGWRSIPRDVVEDVSDYEPRHLEISKEDLLEKIKLDCNGLKKSDESTIDKLRNWTYSVDHIEEDIMAANDKCAKIRSLFSFPSKVLSKEEEEYPLAYAILVHKEFAQLMFMFSSFYHPQNEYCFAVSGGARKQFKQLMNITAECFPNVRVLKRPVIGWGQFEIINSTFACVEELSKSKNKWKYFQYLSGVDIPLKTNLEMVKILKSLNGTINAEIKEYQTYRAKNRSLSESPLKPFKSSLSATMPREAIDFIVNSETTQKLLQFLRLTTIADEGFWGTLSGNQAEFPIPGGITNSHFMQFRKQYEADNKKTVNVYRAEKHKMRYYISRYQLWSNTCKGKLFKSSCVFGVGDYSLFIDQPHLVAHKFYIDFEPAAYFCALKEIRQRTVSPVNLDVKPYSELPQVELKNGVPYEKLKNPTWMY